MKKLIAAVLTVAIASTSMFAAVTKPAAESTTVTASAITTPVPVKAVKKHVKKVKHVKAAVTAPAATTPASVTPEAKVK